jgi:hypothetical protein
LTGHFRSVFKSSQVYVTELNRYFRELVMPEAIKRYEHSGAIDVDILEQFLDELWKKAKTDPAMRAELAKHGIDVGQLPRAREEAIQVTRPAAGLSGTEIVVVLVPLAVEVAGDLWRHIIFPAIRRRFGDGALTEVQNTTSPS